MQKESVLYGIIGLLAGSLLTIAVVSNSVNNNNTSMMRMMGIQGRMTMMDEHQEEEKHADEHMQQSMDSMMKQMSVSLDGKHGDEFDKTFLSEMIVHHQGAIDMATQAKIHANHQEIKNMADEIISAQTSEVEQMRAWQKAWGY